MGGGPDIITLDLPSSYGPCDPLWVLHLVHAQNRQWSLPNTTSDPESNPQKGSKSHYRSIQSHSNGSYEHRDPPAPHAIATRETANGIPCTGSDQQGRGPNKESTQQ
jgi:hypothetical protein